ASAAGCRDQYLTPNKHNVKKVRTAMLCLLNRERTKRGVKALDSHRALRKAAQRHSGSMVRRSYFDHTGADGSSPKSRMKKAGYSGGYFAENLSWGAGPYATARNVVRRWMKSSEHRQNILRGVYDHVGVGVAIGNPQGRRGATVTTTFGGR
ncbi:MAG: CAP domain-containing protein, partial [Actinomycetota bacterium]|nr:CAP domain-containing protein [Actinomycetota bacterium]